MKIVIAGLAGLIVGFVAAVAVENLAATGEASKNKRAFAEALTISEAIENYRHATGAYPPLDGDLSKAASYLEPTYISHLQLTDAYAHGYIAFVNKQGAAVVSMGRNGFLVRNGKILIAPNESLAKLNW